MDVNELVQRLLRWGERGCTYCGEGRISAERVIGVELATGDIPRCIRCKSALMPTGKQGDKEKAK